MEIEGSAYNNFRYSLWPQWSSLYAHPKIELFVENFVVKSYSTVPHPVRLNGTSREELDGHLEPHPGGALLLLSLQRVLF